MTPIAVAANIRGRTGLLIVLMMLAALVLLAAIGAFAAVPLLHHAAVGHGLSGALASEGGPPPGH